MPRAKPTTPDVQDFSDHRVITQPNPLRAAIRRTTTRDIDDPIARAEQALAALGSEFQGWMREECAHLAAAYAAMTAQGVNAQTRNDLFRAAHDIKGDAATFGFPAAGAAAESLCRIIEHTPDLACVPADMIAKHIDAILAIVRENAGIHATGTADELSRRLRGIADAYLTIANRDRPEVLELLSAPSLVPG